MDQMAETLTSREVCAASGLTYRQLDYWTRVGVVGDDQRDPGSGNRRHWTRADAAVLAVVAQLIGLGARPSQLRRLALYLRTLSPDHWTGQLFVDPSTGEVSRFPSELASGWFVTLTSYDPPQ